MSRTTVPSIKFWETVGQQEVDALIQRRGPAALETSPGLFFVYEGRDVDYGIRVSRNGFTVKYNNISADWIKTDLSIIGTRLSSPSTAERSDKGFILIDHPEKSRDFEFALRRRVLQDLKVVELTDREVERRRQKMLAIAKLIITTAMPVV